MSKQSSLLSLFAACAAAASFGAPHAAAAPADPACASLQQLGPDLNDLVGKFNAFNSTVSQIPAQYQQTDLLGMVQNVGATGQKAQDLAGSLNQVNGDIQDAENTTQDPGLRESLSQLSDTVGQASEYVGAYANPFAQRPDNSKLTALAVRTGTLVIGYQINYTRVCGIGQLGLPGAQSPAAAAPGPAEDN
ncbi:hypothetical protein [Segniliparus rugosus]|uniref:Uncharacterized protein n=1 Tax=Segniliparus rugosus (strain ATCC BAA-974 / DSM 45345 / CCUG 50838 / CIP 108380 / JCM 13579 / CDC 945) TaxID=679197 RepID=E5XNY1_SEGRC|nr:hypothetical protein [Segniliparus rugosus]EFV13950.1 hypothetical protein HMPREF9336_01202 [Segniliparus rugosus ATCC BAA-974]